MINIMIILYNGLRLCSSQNYCRDQGQRSALTHAEASLQTLHDSVSRGGRVILSMGAARVRPFDEGVSNNEILENRPVPLNLTLRYWLGCLGKEGYRKDPAYGRRSPDDISAGCNTREKDFFRFIKTCICDKIENSKKWDVDHR